MYALAYVLLLVGSLAFVTCVVWLHWRALRDGAIHDVLLFITGISIFSYIGTRWERATRPVFGIIGAAALVAIAVIGMSVAERNPSPEEVAAEVNPLILQEWRKHPQLREATIQEISL